MAEVVRAFVAVELPPQVLGHLGDLLRSLRHLGLPAVRWVRPGGTHLTVKFLGDVEVSRLPAVQGALVQAARGCAPFHLHLQGTGVFPPSRSPRVVWVGLSGDVPALQALQEKVEHSLSRQGFPREGRPFTPHLTLGRVRAPLASRDRENLLAALAALPVDGSLAIAVDGLSLMQSTLLPGGARYDQLKLVLLEG